jgi:RNA polymerase sigma factor (sigma-70 family)
MMIVDVMPAANDLVALRPRMVSLATRFANGDRDLGEDIAQEAMIRALQGLDKFRGECPLDMWALQIVAMSFLSRRKYADMRHRHRRVDMADIQYRESRAPSPVTIAERRDQLAKGLHAFKKCECLSILAMVVDDDQWREIAAKTGLSVTAVKSRFHRARKLAMAAAEA